VYNPPTGCSVYADTFPKLHIKEFAAGIIVTHRKSQCPFVKEM
jgi:hypothetical protein